MSSYAIETPHGRRRLLSHCALVGRALKRRVPASRRLETALGRDQAQELLESLAIGHDPALRARRRRVRSSP
jgi:hypothetical protein